VLLEGILFCFIYEFASRFIFLQNEFFSVRTFCFFTIGFFSLAAGALAEDWCVITSSGETSAFSLISLLQPVFAACA
jgi:hypothetical protein